MVIRYTKVKCLPKQENKKFIKKLNLITVFPLLKTHSLLSAPFNNSISAPFNSISTHLKLKKGIKNYCESGLAQFSSLQLSVFVKVQFAKIRLREQIMKKKRNIKISTKINHVKVPLTNVLRT